MRYVESSLRELGLKPKMRMIRHGSHVINGKLAVRKKPLYSVYAAVTPSKASALTRIELHCRKKELLTRFFLTVRDLPPRSRYLIFLRYWKKVGSKWEPVNDDLLEQVKSYSIERQTSRHKPRARITRTCAVICPRCGRRGALLLHRMEDGERVLVHVYVLHEDEGLELCELDAMEGRTEEGKRIATFVCKKCGRLGRFYQAVHKVARRVYVRIWHYANGKLEWCILMQLRLLEAEPDQRGSECRDRQGPNPTLRLT